LIYPYRNKWPTLHETSFIAPSADIIGDVTIGAHTSIWFGCVVRGDVNTIVIGARTNVQDHSVLHVTREKHPLVIGNQITIGHGCILHGCVVQDDCLIGMGAILLDGCQIGKGCWIAAGSLVPPGFVAPSFSLIKGSPARVVREIRPDEILAAQANFEHYVSEAAYFRGNIPGATRFQSAQAGSDFGLGHFDF
jgi:carbonic anhydrase/acetyltransferase-like protein (isoleucine patch superfamily)